jgi:membrane protein YdbS with pleckstrin-like domain
MILNPKANHELPCCSAACYNSANDFVHWDVHNRMKCYLFLFTSVIFNLVSFGFEWTFRWRFLPLIAIGIVIYVYPLVFTRYAAYQRYGIKKTLRIVKGIAAAIALLGLILIILGN